MTKEGTEFSIREGQTLLDRVKFAESDLLEYFYEKPQPLDRVIGCIPQVLNPELSVMQEFHKLRCKR